MAVLPVVIDFEAPAASVGEAPLSLLTVPLGTSSLLDHLSACLEGLPGRSEGDILVMPSYPVGQDYAERIRACSTSAVRVIQPEELAGVLHSECEVGDHVLLMDPRRWPAGEFDLAAAIRRHGDFRAATHVIGVGSESQQAREQVAHDPNGSVQRVQRLYDRVAWPDVASTGIFLSMVPAWTMRDTQFTSLGELRAALVGKGVVSRDVPLALDVGDLTQMDELLALNAAVLAGEDCRAPRTGFTPSRTSVLIGRDCRVHPSARFMGPVVLHDEVSVGEGAIMIGPTVVGCGSEVEGDTVVAQSVLAPRTTVRSGATVRHCVACGSCSGSSAGKALTSAPIRLRSRTAKGHGSGRSNGGATDRAVYPRRYSHLAAKRVMDVVFSLLGLMVLSPLLVTVAALIKLSSPGPVLFVHRRERKGGKEFPCLKFRTMRVDAHRLQRELYEQNEVDGPQFMLHHDPRVTRLGHWLRATNIDELPQLINVLLGHMSLVGPRPSPFRENQICVPWRRARLSVRPGISGLWQICRSARSGGDFHQWIFYDITYVRHFSIWLDVKILAATVLSRGGRWSVPLSWLVRGESHGGGEDRAQTLAA